MIQKMLRVIASLSLFSCVLSVYAATEPTSVPIPATTIPAPTEQGMLPPITPLTLSPATPTSMPVVAPIAVTPTSTPIAAPMVTPVLLPETNASVPSIPSTLVTPGSVTEIKTEVTGVSEPEAPSDQGTIKANVQGSIEAPFDSLAVIKEYARAGGGGAEDEEHQFNENAKRKSVVDLVERASSYFAENSLAQSCHIFSHTKQFVRGELYVFVYGVDGRVLAHGQETDLLWKNLYDMRDSFGTPVVQSLVQKAQEGGGWVVYNWRNAIKVSYVKAVKKDGKTYVLGAGYYPHSKPDAVVNLVKGAVAFFYKTIKEGRRVEDAFSPLSYPIGRFVYGDLYLYALDFKGNNLAHGDRPGLIGTNAWDYKDSNGLLVNQEIVKRLSNTDGGIWIEYVSGGAPKRAYVEKVRDLAGNNYFLACGYYPDADRRKVVELVRKGYQFMKTHGLSAAERSFSDTRSDDYRYGDLFLTIYDMNGKVLVQGLNTEAIGKNHLDFKDEDGKFYVRDLIKKAQTGGGWVDARLKGSYKSMYAEKADLGISSFVIVSGVYPISKQESMELLAKSAADYLDTHEPEQAFAEFVNKDGQFIRGDLTIFVFDTEGYCYAFGGDENGAIWRPLLEATDDNGAFFVKDMIETAKYGAATVRFKLNGANKIGYVKMVTKKDKSFVVGSSYFQ